jgi:hypothetical protein
MSKSAHEPPEDGRKYGPKRVGGQIFLKMFLSVLSINVNLCFLKHVKVCMSWNKKK